MELCRGYEHCVGSASYEEAYGGYSRQRIDYSTVVTHATPFQPATTLHVPIAITPTRVSSIRKIFHERFGNPPYRAIVEAIRDEAWTDEDNTSFELYVRNPAYVFFLKANQFLTTKTVRTAVQEVLSDAYSRVNGQLSNMQDTHPLPVEVIDQIVDIYQFLSIMDLVIEKLKVLYSRTGLSDAFLQKERELWMKWSNTGYFDESGRLVDADQCEKDALAALKASW